VGAFIARLGSAAAAVAIAIVTLGVSSSAAPTAPTFSLDFPAGQYCTFELHVDGFGPGSQVSRSLPGNRVLTGGTGFALVFKNAGSGATFSTPANGSVQITTTRPNGHSTLVATGHNVILLASTDHPAGPSTTLYVGRVVIDIDAAGNYTLLQASGTTTDICAALSS